MITKSDKNKAQLYYKENIEGEPLTWEVPINCYLAACRDKNKEIAKYKKYAKGLLDIFAFVCWVDDNGWKQASNYWYKTSETSEKTEVKSTEELFDIFLNIKNKK